MKLTIERGALLKSLAHVQSVVERRNTIPILSNVLLEASDGSLGLTATDMDLTIVERVSAAITGDSVFLLGASQGVITIVRGALPLALFGTRSEVRLEPRGQNLFAETASSGQPQQGQPGANGLGTIQQGYLESSNVNVVQELVTMIQTQRAYEINSKAIQTSDQMLQRLTQM